MFHFLKDNLKIGVEETVLFEFIRLAFGCKPEKTIPKETNWQKILDLSIGQNVALLAFSGLVKYKDVEIDEDIRYKWLGHCLVLAGKNNHLFQVAKRLADKWTQEGLNVFLLKGFSIAQFYPKMTYRECVDIDVYLYKVGCSANDSIGWELGNALMETLGVTVNKSDYRHSIINYEGVKIENHRICASSVKGNPLQRKLDLYMKSLMSRQKNNDYSFIGDTNLISPPPLFNLIFFMQHAYNHFMNEGLTLRHICDWGVLIKAYQDKGEVFWNDYHIICEMFGFSIFSNSLSRIVFLVCGVKAPWFLSPPLLEHQDYILLSDCFKKRSIKVTYTNSVITHFQQAINKICGYWKYRYYSDRSFLADILHSFWGTVVEKNYS